MKRVLFFILLLMALPVRAYGAGGEAASLSLKVYYLEFPPYYYTTPDFKVSGFLFKMADEAFRRAGIEAEYESASAKRILQDLRFPRPAASIGWFKTPEREQFAKYSVGIYQNKPLHILYLVKNGQAFEGKDTLAAVMADKSLVFGVDHGYSFGPGVDAMLKKGMPTTRECVGGFPQLVRMLAADQFSYLLVAPEEIDILIGKNYLDRAQFRHKGLSDIPAGNVRHIIFSREVPDEVIVRVNEAILDIKKSR